MRILLSGVALALGLTTTLAAQDDYEETKAAVPHVIGAQQDQGHLTPQQIQQQLDEAERQFQDAKSMFNPNYTGPLVTASATMVPPGYCMLQPYIVVQDNHAAYNKERHSVSVPYSKIFVNPFTAIQIGVTKTMDSLILPGGIENFQDGHGGGGFQDLVIGLGFLIQKQGPWIPQVKFSVQQTFPTGRYQHLSNNGLGLGGSGGGSWQTQFVLTTAKVLFWAHDHPMNTRLSFQYKIGLPVYVEGFNTYGGGATTRGKVRPGNVFNAQLGLELSLNQAWVIATDVVYSAQNATTYSGVGVSCASPYNDNLSLAPALEYNWNENLGVIAGFQFSVYGRNSPNFVNGQFSVCWVFPS